MLRCRDSFRGDLFAEFAEADQGARFARLHAQVATSAIASRAQILFSSLHKFIEYHQVLQQDRKPYSSAYLVCHSTPSQSKEVKMSLGNLQQNLSLLEQQERLNKALAAKIAVAEETKARGESTSFLLKFELAQIKAQIHQNKKDVEELEREQRKLISDNQDLNLQVKQIRNYFGYVNSLQVDRKADWIQNLKGELSALDFTLEARQLEPTLNVDAFSQYRR